MSKAAIRMGVLLGILSQLFAAVKPPQIAYVIAVVNKPAAIPCSLECLGEAKWSIFIPVKADVAECDKERCWFKDPFQKSFTFSGDKTKGNISLLLRSVTFNDVGSYRCSCDGQVAEVKLKVVDPRVVGAHEQESVSLPCYGDTRKEAQDVQWKKDGQIVLQFNGTHVTTGKEFEGRVSLPPEAFKVGDLSLHMILVRQSDAGLYVCSIHHESREGDPRAVQLDVKKTSQPVTSRPVILAFIFALISVALAALLLLLCWRKKIAWQDITGLFSGRTDNTNPSPSVQESNPLVVLEKSSATIIQV